MNFRLQISASATVFLVLMQGGYLGAQQWVPPTDPDPSAIRDEAEMDVQEGRFGLAAEKYLWYHENALKYEPALSGVRLSYALGDWHDLAEKYPPALRDMRLVRDRAEESIRSRDRDPFEFIELVALNSYLAEDGRTIELFKWLDQYDRKLARNVFVIAQDVLVHWGELELCEKYMVGRNSFDYALEDHQKSLRWLNERYDGNVDENDLEAYEMMFARRAGFIISVLVNRDRPAEAEVYAEKALANLKSEIHRITISDALEGIPPEKLR